MVPAVRTRAKAACIRHPAAAAPAIPGKRRDAYGLLVKAEGQPNETWRFLDAFSWQLWVAIPLTSIAAGCIVWALDKAAFWGERRAAALNEPKSPLAPATISAGTLNEKIWEGLGRAMGVRAACLACRDLLHCMCRRHAALCTLCPCTACPKRRCPCPDIAAPHMSCLTQQPLPTACNRSNRR